MAQRGGSVSTQVRYGDKVFSPIIGEGQADVLVAFEQMEAIRYSSFLKTDGIAIINRYKIIPMPVAAGQADYPDGTIEAMTENFHSRVVDAYRKAEELGNPKCMNVILMGVLINVLGLKNINWVDILRNSLPQKNVDLNIRALEAGLAM